MYAAYLSSTFSLFKDFINGKGGLRYERTSTHADFNNTIIPDYNTWAPSFVLSHKIAENQAIKLSYSYRIQRPGYGDLNPFYNISDPHNINTGNPNLRPERGHNYEISYNKSFEKGGNFFISTFYHRNNNDLQSFTTFYELININGTNYSNVSLTQRYNVGTQSI